MSAPRNITIGRLTIMFGCAWGCIWPERTFGDRLHNALGHWGWTKYDWPAHMRGDWFLEIGPINLSWWANRYE